MLELRNEMKDDTSENEVSFLSWPKCWRVAGSCMPPVGAFFKDRKRSQEKKELKGNAFPQSCLAQQTAWALTLSDGCCRSGWLLSLSFRSGNCAPSLQICNQKAGRRSTEHSNCQRMEPDSWTGGQLQ